MQTKTSAPPRTPSLRTVAWATRKFSNSQLDELDGVAGEGYLLQWPEVVRSCGDRIGDYAAFYGHDASASRPSIVYVWRHYGSEKRRFAHMHANSKIQILEARHCKDRAKTNVCSHCGRSAAISPLPWRRETFCAHNYWCAQHHVLDFFWRFIQSFIWVLKIMIYNFLRSDVHGWCLYNWGTRVRLVVIIFYLFIFWMGVGD